MYPSLTKLIKTAPIKREQIAVQTTLEMPDIRTFVKCLSRYVTELPLTYPGSFPLFEFSEIFMPVLTNVHRVRLNQSETPAQDSRNIIEILQLILKRNKHLSCALIQFQNMICSNEKDFQLVWSALYNPSGDQSLQEVKKEETVVDDVVVDTQISSVVLSISEDHEESFRALCPALSQWRNLQSLCLNFYSGSAVNINVADFASMIDGLASSAQLRHLALLNLHCEQHEEAILKIAAPNTCSCNTPVIHPPNAPIHPPSTRLESLTLSLCTFRTAMLERIIVENTPCGHATKNDELSSTTNEALSCWNSGLTSLEISWDDMYDENVNTFLRKNRNLKQLKMKLQYFRAFRGLLSAVQGRPVFRVYTQHRIQY